MFGIHQTEVFSGQPVLRMGSYGAFCLNAGPADRIAIPKTWDRTTGTDGRLRTGTGTCTSYVGVGPQVAVWMPAGA